MNKRRILVVSGDRAEHGLLVPLYDELCKRDDLIAKWCLLDSHEDPSENLIIFREELDDFQPHIVLLPCDRMEIVYIAAYAFHKGYFSVHFHAGNFSANHPDDINRRAISLFSNLMLCNMPEHKINLMNQGEEKERIYVVGSTAFDTEIDDSLTPKTPFNLVILHPEPDSAEKTKTNLKNVLTEIVKSKDQTIWIYPNHDRNYEIITNYLDTINNAYKNLPRPQFLSLLKHCTTAIGNSSAFYYELPFINSNVKFIHIGERNKGLFVPATETGGSKRIAELLATIKITEKLRVKRLRRDV